MDKTTTITGILEEVKESICDSYCKYADIIKNVHMTDAEYNDWLEKYCSNCPLDRL